MMEAYTPFWLHTPNRLVIEKKVLLFSGGLDSYIVGKLTNPDIWLYVNIGTKDGERELEHIRAGQFDCTVTIDDRLKLADQELSNKIIPMRNLFLALIGFYYGNRVILGATAGDTTLDKDQRFARLTDKLMDHLAGDLRKNPAVWYGTTPELRLPYKHMTKTELVRAYLKLFSPDNLYHTRSCYASEHLKECGACRSCFRKWVAFVNNDLETKSIFITDPLTVIEPYVELCRQGYRGKKEDRETILAYETKKNHRR